MSRADREHAWSAERLLDHAYVELDGRARRRLEAHLAACPACRAELAAIEATRRAMRPLPVEPAPARGEAALLAAARAAAADAARQRERPRATRWLWATPAVAGLAALTVLAVTRLGGDPWRTDEHPAAEVAPPAPAPQVEREKGEDRGAAAGAPAPQAAAAPAPPAAEAPAPRAKTSAAAKPAPARKLAAGEAAGARPAPASPASAAPRDEEPSAQPGSAPPAAPSTSAPPANDAASPESAGALVSPQADLRGAAPGVAPRAEREGALAGTADVARRKAFVAGEAAPVPAPERARTTRSGPQAGALTVPFAEDEGAPGEAARAALSRWVKEGPADARPRVTAYLEPGRADAAERARRRADAVAAMLRDAGVDASRLAVVTLAPEPCAGDLAACAAAARRVVVTREPAR